MLRGAIIGLGSMGQNHLACYKSVDNAKIIAVCDVDRGTQALQSKTRGLTFPLMTTWQSLLKRKSLISLIL